MYIRQCEICKGLNNGVNHVIQITDDKEQLQINGHQECTDELLSKLANMNVAKMSVDKIKRELNL